MEQLDYNLLFRWFVGLEMDELVWNRAVFSKNRDRLLNQEAAQQFFATVKTKAQDLMSDEHFTVDGTLMETWASRKSFQRKGGGDQPGVEEAPTSTERSGPTRRTNRRPIRKRVCTKNLRDKKRS